MAEVPPVHLGLLCGQRREAQIGFGLGPGPVQGHQMTEVIGATGVATFLDHAVESTGGQGRELRQGVADERQGGVEAARAARGVEPWQAGLRQDPGDGAVMHAQLGGDGADAPAFGVVVAQDAGFEFRADGHQGLLGAWLGWDRTREVCRKSRLSQPEQDVPQKWQHAVPDLTGESAVAASRPTAEFAASRSSCAGGIEP
jgi:hypothetical protein